MVEAEVEVEVEVESRCGVYASCCLRLGHKRTATLK